MSLFRSRSLILSFASSAKCRGGGMYIIFSFVLSTMVLIVRISTSLLRSQRLHKSSSKIDADLLALSHIDLRCLVWKARLSQSNLPISLSFVIENVHEPATWVHSSSAVQLPFFAFICRVPIP